MSLEVKQLENELMKSNCFIITDWTTHSCVIIDPGSEKSEREVEYIESNQLSLDYIILTHEHTDHTWGVNALKEKYPNSKIVCSELCEKYAKKSSKAYFLFYFERKGYRYDLLPADIIVKDDNLVIIWNNEEIKCHLTPGHSKGSMCIEINGDLYSGDTIMPYPAHLNKRDSSVDDFVKSVEKIKTIYSPETIIRPGHGDIITFQNWLNNYYNI